MRTPETNYTAAAALTELDQYIQPLGTPGEGSWPQPERLGGQLPPVDSMMPEMLPSSLRAMAEDVADRMQVPLDFPAVVAVATLAGLVAGGHSFSRSEQTHPGR